MKRRFAGTDGISIEMTIATDVTTPQPFSITASAAKRIRRIIADEPDGTLLRVGVNGGGCQGFSYEFEMTRERRDEDVAIERDGVTVLVDSAALDLIAGSELDFVDNLIGQSFQVKNPNAASTCGCGTSFSI